MLDLADLSRVPDPSVPPRWRRYIQSLVHLRPEQAAYLVARRVVSRVFPDPIPTVHDTPRVRDGAWTLAAPALDDPAAATFRPEVRALRLIQLEKTLGDPVDWTPREMPLLWQLELNYFHWMPGHLPWASARPWVVDWLDHAPRAPRTPCWLPYTVAQRFLKWTGLIRHRWREDVRHDPLWPRLLRELLAHGRFLARHQEKDLLGNHLLKTAVALYAGGRFFEGTEADGWLRQSRRILRRELAAQILADGGHYERSPMYHLMVLADLVAAWDLTPAGDPFAEELRASIEAMGRFASLCTHGDQEVPLFNDSVLDQAPRRTDVLRYAARVCPALLGSSSPEGFVALPDFGLFRLGDRHRCLWLDAGENGPPFQQGHAHADTGSFELSVDSYRIVCDSGVFSYQAPERRAWDRSTPAHSTVSIAGESSSDCWGSFRMARRARIRARSWTDNGNGQSVAVRHDGFRHLPGAPWHERTVSFRDGGYTIRDRVGSRRPTVLRCDTFLYLGPDVTVRPSELSSDAVGLRTIGSFLVGHEAAPALRLRIDVAPAMPVAAAGAFVEPASFAPKFHTDRPGQRIRVACLATGGPIALDWRLVVERGL